MCGTNLKLIPIIIFLFIICEQLALARGGKYLNITGAICGAGCTELPDTKSNLGNTFGVFHKNTANSTNPCGNKKFLKTVGQEVYSNALFKASIEGDTSKITTLVEALTDENEIKALLNHETSSGETALTFAVQCEHIETAKELIRLGANLIPKEADDDHTPFYLASKKRLMPLVQYFIDNDNSDYANLIQTNFDTIAKNSLVSSATLEDAAQSGDMPLFKLLLVKYKEYWWNINFQVNSPIEEIPGQKDLIKLIKHELNATRKNLLKLPPAYANLAKESFLVVFDPVIYTYYEPLL